MTLRASAKCRRCGAPIAWAHTTAGKPLALDPAPHARGTVSVTRSGRALTLADTPDPSTVLYRKHFARCKAGGARRR